MGRPMFANYYDQNEMGVMNSPSPWHGHGMAGITCSVGTTSNVPYTEPINRQIKYVSINGQWYAVPASEVRDTPNAYDFDEVGLIKNPGKEEKRKHKMKEELTLCSEKLWK